MDSLTCTNKHRRILQVNTTFCILCNADESLAESLPLTRRFFIGRKAVAIQKVLTFFLDTLHIVGFAGRLWKPATLPRHELPLRLGLFDASSI